MGMNYAYLFLRCRYWHTFEVPCTPLTDHTLYTSHLSHVNWMWYLAYVTIRPTSGSVISGGGIWYIGPAFPYNIPKCDDTVS